MLAVLYKNYSDDKYLTKNLQEVGRATVKIKEKTNVLTPTITLSTTNASLDCNYIYLEDMGGRYYFVKDKRYGEQYIELVLDADDLVNLRAGLLNCDVIVARNENRYNSYLNDERYTRLQYGNPVLKLFPNGFSKNLSYILTVAGGN